jgi:hypothetical protein
LTQRSSPRTSHPPSHHFLSRSSWQQTWSCASSPVMTHTVGNASTSGADTHFSGWARGRANMRPGLAPLPKGSPSGVGASGARPAENDAFARITWQGGRGPLTKPGSSWRANLANGLATASAEFFRDFRMQRYGAFSRRRMPWHRSGGPRPPHTPAVSSHLCRSNRIGGRCKTHTGFARTRALAVRN